LEAFAKFGSDLDAATKSILDKGFRNVEILKQPQYSPVSVEKQVAIIHLGTKGLLRDVAINKVREFEKMLMSILDTRHPDVLKNFRAGKLNDDDLAKLEAASKELAPQFK
jgi:F-type H+-transporting ATPase subunit alpha